MVYVGGLKVDVNEGDPSGVVRFPNSANVLKVSADNASSTKDFLPPLRGLAVRGAPVVLVPAKKVV